MLISSTRYCSSSFLFIIVVAEEKSKMLVLLSDASNFLDLIYSSVII